MSKISSPPPTSGSNTPPEPNLSERQRVLNLLAKDLPSLARFALKIRDKQGKIIPFELNKAQLYTHQKLEEQKKKLGFVRAIILKARQLGLSTYVAARYYQRTAMIAGTSTFILSHQAKTTGPLFDMVKRFNDRMPPGLVPLLDTANKNQLRFAGTSSEYTVGTAGNEDVGRGLTITNLHCSEAAFYERTDELETGLFQAVADLPGTEIILESTANGMNNMFYRMTMAALAGQGLYQVIFIPWFWDPMYALPVPEGFVPTEKELALKELYKLTDEQIFWRRKKIESYGGQEYKFLQEYPSDPREAFLVSGESFFSKEALVKARLCNVVSPNHPVIMGIDAARTNDRSVFVIRQGRKVLHYEVHQDLKADESAPTQQLASIAIRLIDKFNVHKVFIDAGYGYGLLDELHRLGYKKIVMGVQFSQQPMDPIRFLNKRAEMYGLARDAFDEGNFSIPDTDEFMFDLLLTGREKESPTKRMFLPPKTEIRSKHGVSPDISDAFVLTFAFPVAGAITSQIMPNRNRSAVSNSRISALSTINRLQQPKLSSTSVKVNF
jgi:hypothetical protein